MPLTWSIAIPKFLSTPSVGRATQTDPHDVDAWYISIHALRGEGDLFAGMFEHQQRISIHALRGEGDVQSWKSILANKDFYPRPPWGGRRWCLW